MSKPTIQHLLVALFQSNPYATNEEIRDNVMEHFPNSVYYQRYADRAQKDRNRYNRADFKCMEGRRPAVRAENPTRRPELVDQLILKLDD